MKQTQFVICSVYMQTSAIVAAIKLNYEEISQNDIEREC